MFHGRLRDMLKVGGENVAAVEIETWLQNHEAVKLAQVVGVPHPRLIEVPAGFKVPRYVRFVDEWPVSSTKIQKFRLQDQLIEELGL